MRLNEQDNDRAKAATSVVLPTPGTSSMSTCPLHSRAMSASSMASSLPTMTRRMFCCRVYTMERTWFCCMAASFQRQIYTLSIPRIDIICNVFVKKMKHLHL